MRNSKNCVFCKIVQKKIQSWTLFEDENVIVFLDVKPVTKGHCLVVPKKCCQNILQLSDSDLFAIHKKAQLTTQLLIKKLQPKGFNIVNNFNAIAGQVVNHYHLHIIPKYEKKYGLSYKQNTKEEASNLEDVWKKLKFSK